MAFVGINADFTFHSSVKSILIISSSQRAPNTAIIAILIRERKHAKLRTVALKSVLRT